MASVNAKTLLVLLCSLKLTYSIDPKTKDPNYHIATSTQMTIKKDDGTIV